MNRRREDRPSLHERIHGSPSPPPDAPELGRASPPRAPVVRPCWVTDRYGRQPGLLFEWRKVAAGWQGRVVRPITESDSWVVVEEWLPAELLESA